MNQKKLLSVIVPCYNVAQWVEKCVASITRQTYKELEIILVDDGSTDNTPSLLDSLAAQDKRIRVIHQKNQGSSITRENGLKASKGAYVTFVDADDRIHEKMYETMVGGLDKEQADIAVCGVCDAYPTPPHSILLKHRRIETIDDTFSSYGRVEAMCLLLEDKWIMVLWNKVFRRETFKDVKFPVGRGIDDDTSVMHQIFHNAEKLLYFNSEFYYYFYRVGSQTKSYDEKSVAKKIVDNAECRWERYIFAKEHPEYHDALKRLENVYISVTLKGLRFVYRHPDLFPEGFAESIYKRIKSINLPYSQLESDMFCKAKKVEYLLFKHCFPLYRFLAARVKK